MRGWSWILLGILAGSVFGFAKLLPEIGPKVEFGKEKLNLHPKRIKRVIREKLASLRSFKAKANPMAEPKGKYDARGPPKEIIATPSSLSYYGSDETKTSRPKPQINRNRDKLGPEKKLAPVLLYKPKFPAYRDFKMCKFDSFDVANDGKLGKGGFGSVFLARHNQTGTPVAIKMTSGESIKKSPKHVENEETIHGRLVHPFIARFYCTMADPHTSDVYFAMEYVPGLNMAKKISKDFPIAHNHVQKWMAQIILALEYLHDQCIVYRDMKAENVLVDENGNAKLIDFGLSVYDCDNQLKNVAGTLEYTAPEMAARKPHGRAIDYYGLGVLLYTIKMGRLPFPFKRSGLDKKQYLDHLVDNTNLIPTTTDSIYDDLISKLCDRVPETRWGLSADSRKALRRHDFFNGLDWTQLEEQVRNEKQYHQLAPRNNALFSQTTPLNKLLEAI